ncbi:MAG: NADH-quinone oxidoreductase subunit L, partial [Acidobacteria bacterium]
MLVLIPLIPCLGFIVNAVLGRRLTKSASAGVACTAMIASFGVALATAWPFLFGSGELHAVEQNVYTWIKAGDFVAPFSLRVDPLAALMILVVTGIGSLIHVYSTSYMHDEPASEYARFFSYLNLFAAFMLVLVLGSNFLVMFVGWEGVGLCSYLLIGFWYKKTSAADAGKKAFIVNRIGDFGFLLGMFLAFVHFGTLDFQRIATALAPMAPEATFGTVSAIALLL